jgi:chromosome partitioning protein
MKAKIIAVINQKGGVGKTTTALSIGTGLRLKGYKVLLIDLDGQGNLSLAMDAAANAGFNSMDVITGRVSAKDAVQRIEQGDIIVSSPALDGADAVITATGKEYKLKEALAAVTGGYDYIIIDTPPAIGVLTVNALTAANGCIIPAKAAKFSLQGIGQVYATILTVRKYCNSSVKIMGIVLTQYNERTNNGRNLAEKIEQIAAQYKTKLYKTKISVCTKIEESQTANMNIFDYAPGCKAAEEYKELVEEILKEGR